MRNIAAFKPVGWSRIVDHADNLARGLRGAWIFNEINSTSIINHGGASRGIGIGVATMQTTPIWDGSPWGTALKFTSAASDYATFAASSPFRATYPFSIACRVKVVSGGSGAQIWTNDDALDKYSGVTLLASNTGAFKVRLGGNTGIGASHRKDLLSATAGGADVWLSAAFNVYSISSFESFLNGALDTGGTSGTGTALQYSSLTPTGSMGREDESATNPETYSDCSIDYIYFWSGRSLSAADARNLAIDPYHIFKQESRAKFFVTVPTGWGHKINAVSNASISKICGVSKASISKVSGVA